MGVTVQRDIGDRQLPRGEIGAGLEMVFHHLKRGIAALHPVLKRMRLQVAAAFDQRQPEIGSADIGLERVLLEEHPLQRFGALDP